MIIANKANEEPNKETYKYCLVAFSANLITMFFFYEMLTLVTLPLIIFDMSKEAKNAIPNTTPYVIT